MTTKPFVYDKEVKRTYKYYISLNEKVIGELYKDLLLELGAIEKIYIYGLKVDVEYRGKGYATQLIEKALKEHERRIELKVDKKNSTNLIKFYRKFGFKRKGKTDIMYIPARKVYKEGEKTKLKCPNCSCRMRRASIYYMSRYTHGYDDLTRCSTSTSDNNGYKCGKCGLTFAGGRYIEFKGFEINTWDKNYTVKQRIEDVKNGEGRNVIEYD